MSDLNVVLNDITGVQKANCFDVLLNSFIIFLLLEKFVSMLFYDFTLNFLREVSFFSNGLGLGIM